MRIAIAALFLLLAARAGASQHAMVINLEGCASVGPSPVLLWSDVPSDHLNDSVMADGIGMGVLLCDADLPPDAVRFDYAEMEYTPGCTVGPPWLTAYAVRRQVGPGAQAGVWLDEVGSCGGLDSAAAPPWDASSLPLSICQTPGGLETTGSVDRALSLLFVVYVPTNNFASVDRWECYAYGQPMSQVYRIVAQYE